MINTVSELETDSKRTKFVGEDEYPISIVYRRRTIAVAKVVDVKVNKARPDLWDNVMTIFADAAGNYYLRQIRGYKVDRAGVKSHVEHYANQARLDGRSFDHASWTRSGRSAHRRPLYSITKMTRRWAMTWAIGHIFCDFSTRDFLQGLVAIASKHLPREGW